MSKERGALHGRETVEDLIAAPLVMGLVTMATLGLPIAGIIGAINSELGSEMALKIVGGFAILGAIYGLGSELALRK